MSFSNHQRNEDDDDDDNNNQNRRSPPTQPKDDSTDESNEEETASDDCGTRNAPLGLLSQMLARGAGISHPFNTNPRSVLRNSEEQRRLLISILESAVRICNDEGFAPSLSTTNSRRTSSSSNSNSEQGNKQKRPDLQ